jgi:tetratricopeptide (TPR) repeat protein
MGSVVHLAARLEQAAAPGSALISAETCKATQGAFETRSRQLAGLRGLPSVVHAFELVRWKSERAAQRPHRTTMFPTIFVGREEPLAMLDAALRTMGRKRGRTLCISGEAGVGKSRLIAEFISGLGSNVRLCASYSSPYKRAFGYGPVADLVADLASIRTDTPSEERKRCLSELVSDFSEFGTDDQASLATLVDIESSYSNLVSLPPFDRRLRVEAAAIELFNLMSRDKPLIMVIEDVQWLDNDGLDQVVRICEALRTASCLILFSVRDKLEGAAAELIEATDYRCDLTPLQPAEAAQLVNTLVRRGRGTVTLSREIVERTQGNPLFIEETFHTLHQLGALIREGQIYALQSPGVNVPLPPTVRGLLAARIDLLTNTQKDVLQATAVMGPSATRDLLRSLFDLDATIVDRAIQQLIAAELLSPDVSSLSPSETTLRFRHPLIREVVYEQMLVRERVRIHRWMLVKLEQEDRRGLRKRSDILAEHAFNGEVWEKAAQYLLRSGNEAFWRDAKTEAVRFLLRGLEALSKGGRDQEDSVIGLEIRLELRNPLYQLGRMDELADHLAAARPMALRLAHPTHTGRYHIFQSHYHWFVGNSGAAQVEAESAEALAQSGGLSALTFRARFQKGLASLSRGELRQTIAIMDEVSAWITGHKPNDAFGMNNLLLVTTLGYSARARAELGDFRRAREDAARSLAVARELDNHFAWVFAYIAEGWLNLRTQNQERAVPFLEQAYEICATEDVPLMGPVAASFLSLALLPPLVSVGGEVNIARVKRALALAETAVKQASEFKFGTGQPMRLAILSHALLASGRNEDALETAQLALDAARTLSERTSAIEALFAVSKARYSLRMNWEQPLQEAASISEALHMGPTLAYCKQLELTCNAQRSTKTLSVP